MSEPVDLIFYNKVMDRIGMRQLISRLIFYFGITYTTHILDQLKTLGFQYATLGAISLGIDDLLTAPSKGWLIQDAEQYTNLSEKHFNYGNLHAVEKLRQPIETWYATSEYLKQEMNPNFRMTDPSNSVHMMSFSGARGSISQVHQSVGMRGLMSDPQGQIIDLPIQSNFREGLSLTEYIISCYGARKGVVDTAVRTSDAGYLTRRLVEVVQRIIVRKIDCGSIYGILISYNYLVKKKIYQQKLIGRVLAENVYINNRCFAIRNQDIGAFPADKLTDLKKKTIYVRSPLTCNSILWVCQSCYGWSPANGNLIEMGEAVGIIAGQSIGEPGTQLTPRTFHTGGVFTGDIAEHVRTPFNGIIKFDENFIYPTRTRHGHPAWMCQSTLFLSIRGGDEIHNITIPQKSLLLVQNNQYVESKQVIAEIRAKILPSKEKVEKYIYSNLEGEMYWSTKVGHASEHFHSDIRPILRTSHIWILSGRSLDRDKKLPLFHKNQDKIDPKILIAEERNIFYSLQNKNHVNICISNYWIFRRNQIFKKSGLTDTILNDLNKSVNSNIILSGYNVLKTKKKLILREKYTTFFTLEISKNGILRNNEVFAIANPPEYRLDNSGIIQYGTIKVGSIDKNYFVGTETEFYRTRYTIVKGGCFFHIPEETYLSTKNLSSILVKNNEFIQAGTSITSSIVSDINGLIKIRKGINNTYEVRVLPGNIYHPNKKYEISKQISILISPGKRIFDDFRCNDWSYLQWVIPFKQKPFSFIRPATRYEVCNDSEKSNLLNLLQRNPKLKIKRISYLFCGDGQRIDLSRKKSIRLVQTCLIVRWKEKYFLEKAHISFLKLETERNFRIFIQMNLINYFVMLADEPERMLNIPYVLKKTYYNEFFPLPRDTWINKHRGIIRISSNQDYGIKSFLILSPVDLVSISKIDEPKKFIVDKNVGRSASNHFFDFHHYGKNLNCSDLMKKIDIKRKKLVKNSSEILPSDKFGLIGNFRNILKFFKCFYRDIGNGMVGDNFPIVRDYIDTCVNSEWFFFDECNKIYRFVSEIDINLNSFKLSLLLPSLSRSEIQKFNVGKLLFDNFSISGESRNYPSGQIIGIHINYLVIRLAKPYLATRGAIIHNNYGELVNEGDTLMTLIYERLKSGDIIQGLPKVEQLPEARPINLVSINLENSFEDWNNDMKKFVGNIWGGFLGTKIGMEQAQVIPVDQIRKVYQSQGVSVSDKHIEIIVRQMTSKVVTLEDGLINLFLPGEPIESARARRMNRISEEAIPYEPILLGITKASLNTESFISEASFQETTRVLAKAALKGRIDWSKGLKENVILGGLIPAGTGSQEVIWQITLEKNRELFFGKNETFHKKMKSIFSYQNVFIEIPAIGDIHNLLKGAISEDTIDIFPN